MTITIPELGQVPVWAWWAVGLAVWYVGVGLFLRFTETGREFISTVDEPAGVGFAFLVSPAAMPFMLIIGTFHLLGKILGKKS